MAGKSISGCVRTAGEAAICVSAIGVWTAPVHTCVCTLVDILKLKKIEGNMKRKGRGLGHKDDLSSSSPQK